MNRLLRVAAVAVALWGFAAHASAQTLPTSIAGVVRDSSGGVMPGVTVEASSDVLIEKVRTAITDEHGEYKIIDLRPGTYAVTFSLTGFSTIKRDGVELQSGFAAKIDAELRVGALEETLTVSGQSPVVDVQNTSQVKTVSAEMLFALPMTKDGGYQIVLRKPLTAAGDLAGYKIRGNPTYLSVINMLGASMVTLPASSTSFTVMGATCFVGANAVATARSFQTQRNWKIASEASAADNFESIHGSSSHHESAQVVTW